MALAGLDAVQVTAWDSKLIFQSTRPSRASTAYRGLSNTEIAISIHKALAGLDEDAILDTCLLDAISIHKALAGLDGRKGSGNGR